jgi:uncharacterized protein
VTLSRRQFLHTSAAITAGFAGLHSLFGRTANAVPATHLLHEGFGPLEADPHGLFDLPKGFSYRILSMQGNEMDDGFAVPGGPDGMAAFPGPDGLTIIVRNHELDNSQLAIGPFGSRNQDLGRIEPGLVYDAGFGKSPALGGTTTLLYDTARQRLLDQRISLAGTIRNCAGGPTPWNSWITCEETVQKANDECEKDHGYNFEVPARFKGSPVRPVPLVEMGRFNHEAIAVEEKSGIVYQTEDRQDGTLYRFIPNVPGELVRGGRLQQLVVADAPSLDTRNWGRHRDVPIGQRVAVRWIDVENVQSPDDSLRYEGFEKGAARFARAEGMWAGSEDIYFACTSGGRERRGQIWKYTPSPAEGTAEEAQQPGMLELFVEPNNSGLIDNADNLTVTPWGDLIVCEDGPGEQFLVGITPEGGIYKFGRNAQNDSELAGACFSPDGTTMFVNVQWAGLTLAITGPWRNRLA